MTPALQPSSLHSPGKRASVLICICFSRIINALLFCFSPALRRGKKKSEYFPQMDGKIDSLMFIIRQYLESGEAFICSQALQKAVIPVSSSKTIVNKKKIPCSRAIFTRMVQFLFSRPMPHNLHH